MGESWCSLASTVLIVTITAGIATLALLSAASSGWTDGFAAGNGAILGASLSVFPATLIGMDMAFGVGPVVGRVARGLTFLVLAPLGLTLFAAITTVTTAENKGLHEQKGFFVAFAVLCVGSGSALLWSLVLAANMSTLVPRHAASGLASILCLFVAVPVLGLTLLLLRDDGDTWRDWIGTAQARSSKHDGRPPFFVAIAIAVPYMTLVALIAPYAKVQVLGQALAALKTKKQKSNAGGGGWGRRRSFDNAFNDDDDDDENDYDDRRDDDDDSDDDDEDSKKKKRFFFSPQSSGHLSPTFTHVDVVSVCCCLGTVPAVIGDANAPVRLALVFLLVATPCTLIYAGRLSGDTGTTDDLWTKGTWRVVFPSFGCGAVALRAARTRDTEWWIPICAMAFGVASVAAILLLSTIPGRGSTVTDRYLRATKIARFCVAPWWLTTFAVVDAYRHSSYIFWASVTFLALAASGTHWLGTFFFKEGSGSKKKTVLPSRRDVLTTVPHALLLFSLCYLGLNVTVVQIKIGGAGVFLATLALAAPVTYSGIDMMKHKKKLLAEKSESDQKRRKSLGGGTAQQQRRRSTKPIAPTSEVQKESRWMRWRPNSLRGDLFLSLGVQSTVVGVIYGIHFLMTGSLGGFLIFENDFFSEIKAAALWCFFAVPVSVLGWNLVTKGAEVWAQGHAKEHLRTLYAKWDYYLKLLRVAVSKAEGKKQNDTSDHKTPTPSLLASIKSGFDLSTINAEEAGPTFATLLCVTLFVPFGVFASAEIKYSFGPRHTVLNN